MQPHAACAAERSGKLGGGGIVQEEAGAAVGEDGRQLRGSLAPVERHQDALALPQANSTSKKVGELWQRMATRSPRATPSRSSAAAPRSARSLNAAKVRRRPVSYLLEGDRLRRQLGALGGEIESNLHADPVI